MQTETLFKRFRGSRSISLTCSGESATPPFSRLPRLLSRSMPSLKRRARRRSGRRIPRPVPWGRFWDWDPKENGAALIVLWNASSSMPVGEPRPRSWPCCSRCPQKYRHSLFLVRHQSPWYRPSLLWLHTNRFPLACLLRRDSASPWSPRVCSASPSIDPFLRNRKGGLIRRLIRYANHEVSGKSTALG